MAPEMVIKLEDAKNIAKSLSMSLSLSHCIAVIFSHTRCQHPRVGGSQAFGVGLTMWTILWTAWRHSEQLLRQPWDNFGTIQEQL